MVEYIAKPYLRLDESTTCRWKKQSKQLLYYHWIFKADNKKAFKQDAYHPLANRTCFTSHQMSLPVRCMGVSSSKQVWTGLKGWQTDVTSIGGSWSEQVCNTNFCLQFQITLRSVGSQWHGQRKSLTVQSNLRPMSGINLYTKVCTEQVSRDGH